MRGDIAFVQSQLETGWFALRRLADPARREQLRGDVRVRRPGRASRTARTATRHRAGAWATATRSAHARSSCCAATPTRRRRPHRPVHLRAVGSCPVTRRSGSTSAGQNCPCGKLIWASAAGYGITIIKLYSQALVPRAARPARASRTRRRTRVRSPATATGTSRATGRTYTFGDRAELRRHGKTAPERAADRRRVALERQGLLAAGTRRRDLLVRRREVPRFDRRAAPEQAGERHGAHDDNGGLLARRRRRRHLLVRQTRGSTARPAAMRAEPAGARHGAHRERAMATGCSRPTAASSASATPSSTGRSAPTQLTSPVVVDAADGRRARATG